MYIPKQAQVFAKMRGTPKGGNLTQLAYLNSLSLTVICYQYIFPEVRVPLARLYAVKMKMIIYDRYLLC